MVREDAAAMLIAVCPPDSKLPRSLYESTNLDTSALRAIHTADRTVRPSQASSGLQFGGSSANVELVPPHVLSAPLHPPRASPARSLIATSPDRSNCLSKHRAAGIVAGSAPHGRSDRSRANRQNSPLIEAGRARCASSTRRRRQHNAAACSTSPRILRVATPSASTAISAVTAAAAAAAVIASGSAVAFHYRGFALASPCGLLAQRSRGRHWNTCGRERPRSDCLFDMS
jgi:hypothetical protein